MLNGDDNENGFKTNRSNQQKNKLHVHHTFSSDQQKANLHVQHAFLSFPCGCFVRLQHCTTKTSNFLVKHFFYGEIVVCAYPIFCFQCSCSLLHFTAAHFHLAGRQHFSFSHRRFKFPCFSSNEFSITRSSSFSVIHSIHIKNNAQKDTTLFFLKVRAAM